MTGLLKEHPDIYDLLNRNTAVTSMEQLYHLTRLLGSRYARVLPPPVLPESARGGGGGSGTRSIGDNGGNSNSSNGAPEDPWALKPLFSPRQIKKQDFSPKAAAVDPKAEAAGSESDCADGAAGVPKAEAGVQPAGDEADGADGSCSIDGGD